MWPFTRSPKFVPSKDIPDLTGKVAIVTGGSRGLGLAIVGHLARRGAKVYMAARDEQRAKAAIERLRSEGLGQGEVEWWELDLSKPREVKASGERFVQKESRLDILVNNAGLGRRPYKIESDGVQDVMLVNYIGPFIFTRALLPLLCQTAEDPSNDVRVVMLGSDSIAMLKNCGTRYRNLEDFNEEFRDATEPDQMRYANSKLADVLYSKALQKHFDTKGVPVTVLAADPGWVLTEGVPAFSTLTGKLILALMRPFFFYAPPEGAHSTVFAAASPAVRADREEFKGAYVVHNKAHGGEVAAPLAPQGANTELAAELWKTTEELVKDMGL